MLDYCSTLNAWYAPVNVSTLGAALVCACRLCNVYGTPLRDGDKPQPHMYPMEARHASL